MQIQEMAAIAAAHKWAYGPCDEAMFKEVEQTYERTDLTKEEITWAYWMRTGYYEQAAYAVKKMIEAEKRMTVTLKCGLTARLINSVATQLQDAAWEAHEAEQVIKNLYAKANW